MDKEEEISRRIEQLKRKNELLLQRHMEVEQDKKTAEKSGHSFTNKVLTEAPLPSERKFNDKGGKSQTRAHMDKFDRGKEGRNTGNHNNRERRSSEEHQNVDSNRGSLRGRGRGGKRFVDYQEKRRENFRMMEEEMAQSPTEGDDQTVGVSRFLDDPRRKGELDPERRWQSSRHKGSYGGLEFDNIKHSSRGRGRGAQYRESRGRGRGMSRLQMSAEYTGRERQDQERWTAMREAADREIMSRSKTSQGRWRREWDAQKNEKDNAQQHDTRQLERYEEPRRNHRGGGGRGKRGSGRGRRGSRNSYESGDNGKELNREMNKKTVEEHVDKKPVQGESSSNAEEMKKIDKENTTTQESSTIPESNVESSTPQRTKNNKGKSPRHLVQQRAQTPSSKDGTEVWAQNSHHSDEAGQEWKNGASRSTEQWLPSDEGNRNPAIDERLLEQQEDGATVYSRQLGRGWGDEKNIKATKAWVIDTEKAGTEEQKPIVDNQFDRRGRLDNRDRANVNPKSDRHKNSRLRNVADERSEFRSASPRLRRGNPGLTVEVNKGGLRRVKHHSEGDPTFQLHETKIRSTINTNTETAEKQNHSPNSAKSPVSAGVLKTPEGLKYVEDWALEMDIQSPTYKSRDEAEAAIQPNSTISTSVQEDSVNADNENNSSINDNDHNKKSLDDCVQKNLSTIMSESKNIGETENSNIEISTTYEAVEDPEKNVTKSNSGNCSEDPTVLSSQDQDQVKTLIVLDTEEASDGNFKDAEEGVDDEFFECTGNENSNMPATSPEEMKDAKLNSAKDESSQETSQVEQTTAAASITSENIQIEVQENVQQQLVSPSEGAENTTVVEDSVNKNDTKIDEEQQLISPSEGVDGAENTTVVGDSVSKNDTDSCQKSEIDEVKDEVPAS